MCFTENLYKCWTSNETEFPIPQNWRATCNVHGRATTSNVFGSLILTESKQQQQRVQGGSAWSHHVQLFTGAAAGAVFSSEGLLLWSSLLSAVDSRPGVVWRCVQDRGQRLGSADERARSKLFLSWVKPRDLKSA